MSEIADEIRELRKVMENGSIPMYVDSGPAITEETAEDVGRAVEALGALVRLVLIGLIMGSMIGVLLCVLLIVVIVR